MNIATYSIGGESLAQAAVPAGTASAAFFCPSCGERWANIHVPGARWRVEVASCETCPPCWLDGSRLPGSLVGALVSEDFFRLESSLEWLPPALWPRELEIHLKYFNSKELEA